MGKFGIGARVRTGAVYGAEIVDKRKGERELRFSDGSTGWWDKSELTAILPANDDACDEKCEVAYKVGDRVVCVDNAEGQYTAGNVYVVREAFWNFGEPRINTEVDDGGSTTNGWGAKYFRPFRLEAGRYYKTRDGRKVGPMARPEPWTSEIKTDHRGLLAAFHAVSEPVGHKAYAEDGIWLTSKGDNPHDIVAEWVEPAVEAAAEPAKWKPKVPAFSFKVGDLAKTRNGNTVRIIEANAEDPYPFAHDNGDGGYHACSADGRSCINEDENDVVEALPAPTLTVVAGKRYRGKSGQIHDVISNGDNEYWTLRSNTEPFVDRRFWKADGTAYNVEGFSWATPGDPLVEEVPDEPAAAKPKFRVGDRVDYNLTREAWQGVVVTEVHQETDGSFMYSVACRDRGIGRVCETWIDLCTTPAFPIGAKVTLTATVTGHNPVDKHNVNVVIDGLPAGCASHGIPATALRAA